MPNYFGGLVEGFQGRRESKYKENFEADAARRGQEGKIFEYLLQSGDPEMRALAMSGMFESAQPGKRKGGLGGYLGEVQGGSFYPQILARMNEQVPDPGQGGGPAPPVPGSASMSLNQTTRPGSQPIGMPAPPVSGPEAPGGMDIGMDGPAPPPALMGPQGEMEAMLGGAPPAPPPESKFKRRGTGVPTAEEVAESAGAAGILGRVRAITQSLQAAGAPPEMIQRAIMGISGAPMPLDSTANGPVVADPNDPETPIPTIRHRDGTVTMLNGMAVPPGFVGYVKPTAAGQVSRTMRDPASPTGYSSVRYDQSGMEMFRVPTEFSPPPTTGGTATILDASGNPTVVTTPRNAAPGTVIGTAPSPQPSEGQSSAQALLADVMARINAEETPRIAGTPKRPLAPARRDQLVREAATAAGLPYTTYFELEQATRLQPARQVTPRATAPAGTGASQPPTSSVDRIRQRALEIQQGRSGEPTAPPAPPVRSGGPGPRR